jgi:hypothetical protein
VSGVACKATLESFQTPGFLLGRDTPKTIRDVIRVLRLLGQRYLWVDRLCIIQDDDEDKEKHINNMATIYACARMTVVVAVGCDAEHGLLGIQDVTPPLDSTKRDSGIRISVLGTEHQLTRLEGVHLSKWYSRGWTLQEIVFSRRVLYFTEAGVFWECHCHTWSENTPKEHLAWENQRCTKKLTDIFRDSYFPPWPNLHMYLQLVAAYNNRQLSFDDDILPAFAGITVSLSSSFEGGFLFGLPELFLDVALLWRPIGLMRKRKPSGRKCNSKDADISRSAFPSWSWIGWQAEIDPLSWKCGYDYIKSTDVVSWPGSKCEVSLKASSSWQLKSTVEWHVAEGVDSPTRPVISNYKRYQRSGDIPEGWSRYSLPFEGPEEADFVHLSDMTTRFRFPIPIPSSTPTNPPPTSDGPFLCCSTTKASFYIKFTPANITTSLFQGNGAWVGVVQMHFGQPEDASDSLTGNVSSQEQVEIDGGFMEFREFIAISEGSARNRWNERDFLEEWSYVDRPQDTEFYEFVNVLCIARGENGIYYREGIGRVLKSAWLAQNSGPFQVTLG